MRYFKTFEQFSENRVECDDCGWSWMIQDGGEDLYICHECGHDNTPILGESHNAMLLEKNHIKDFSKKAKDFVKALGREGKETKEILKILYRHIFGNEKMTDAEREQVGEQLKDVLKTLGLTTIAVMPGGVIVALIVKALKLQKHVFPSNFKYLLEDETY